jgi:hypothetical protein
VFPLKAWLVAALVLFACAESHALTIGNDRGGNVAVYVIKKNQLNARGEDVRIFGSCLSACTIYLGAHRVCVGPRAVLGFHSATNAAGTRLMVRQWPPRIRAWVRARGLGRGLIYLKGAQLRALVRACR